MAGTTKRTEFSQALKAIVTERGLDAEVIIETIKQAYVAAYKRDARERGEEVEEMEYDAEIDPVNGEARIIAWDPETPDDKKDVTPPGFGRIAAQTAKQVIHQKIREAEKGAIMTEFSGRVGNLISGMVLRFDGSDVRVDIGRTEAIMPAAERIPSERLNSSQRLTFLLKEIEDGVRGKNIVLSRADDEFVKAIFTREVPEISGGSVEIKGIARDPGIRTKIAVYSEQAGVDPVGSCVGQKGVRVQAVTNELGGERVDIIPWSGDDEEFIKATLAPVEVLGIKLSEKDDEKNAIVTVPEDQLSLAIGKDGQNVRLASKLTGWRIEAEGDPDVKSEAFIAREAEEKATAKAEEAKAEKEDEKEKTEEPKEKETKEPEEAKAEEKSDSDEE